MLIENSVELTTKEKWDDAEEMAKTLLKLSTAQREKLFYMIKGIALLTDEIAAPQNRSA